MEIKGAINKAHQLEQEIDGALSVRSSLPNPANPAAHYKTTGPEIWDQLDGKVDIFVAGAGSGGTFMGVSRYLKEQNKRSKQ